MLFVSLVKSAIAWTILIVYACVAPQAFLSDTRRGRRSSVGLDSLKPQQEPP
jgi:hypothetical protein